MWCRMYDNSQKRGSKVSTPAKPVMDAAKKRELMAAAAEARMNAIAAATKPQQLYN